MPSSLRLLKGKIDIISEAFEALEIVQRIRNCFHFFKDYLAANVRNDEEFYISVVSIFVAKVLSMADQVRKKQYMPSNYIIKQIQEGWKGWIDILRLLSERCSPLEDRKSATFFKVIDVIYELGGPPAIKNSTLIFVDNLEFEISKLKENGSNNLKTWYIFSRKIFRLGH